MRIRLVARDRSAPENGSAEGLPRGAHPLPAASRRGRQRLLVHARRERSRPHREDARIPGRHRCRHSTARATGRPSTRRTSRASSTAETSSAVRARDRAEGSPPADLPAARDVFGRAPARARRRPRRARRREEDRGDARAGARAARQGREYYCRRQTARRRSSTSPGWSSSRRDLARVAGLVLSFDWAPAVAARSPARRARWSASSSGSTTATSSSNTTSAGRTRSSSAASGR